MVLHEDKYKCFKKLRVLFTIKLCRVNSLCLEVETVAMELDSLTNHDRYKPQEG